MRRNKSPWLFQLDKTRQSQTLHADIETDVVVVGAGIAGVATAFFLLKHTQRKVVILEGFKLAHGATGHNAGQIVSYFEKGFPRMVKEFGMSKAAEGQRSIDGAWDLLHEMYKDAKLSIFFSDQLGHDGYSTYEQVLDSLEEAHLKREAGLIYDRMTITESALFVDNIPDKYDGLWNEAPHAQVLELLETDNTMFVAASSVRKGSMNSALFCEKVVDYLQASYGERFALYEHAPVHKIILHSDDALLDVEKFTCTAKRVVLCTNGFENLHIINNHGLEIDAKFHHLLQGRVAYMSAYLEAAGKPPIATSYVTPDEPSEEIPYYYLTRRPYEYEQGEEHNLISVGGPEEAYEENKYSREAEYPERAIEILDRFIRMIYDRQAEKRPEYIFTWHGLMGYTTHGIRLVGEEPQNPVLLYNLGCNGVGILPSIFGGRKIARHIAGEKVPASIFDIPRSLKLKSSYLDLSQK